MPQREDFLAKEQLPRNRRSFTTRRQFPQVGLAGLASFLSAKGVDAQTYLANYSAPTGQADSLTIDVKEFGARGDGFTNDVAPINVAIQKARERRRHFGPFDVCCRIVFPTGVYAVDNSLDLTNLRGINTVVDGNGSTILGRCKDRPVIDALGSRWLEVRDLNILGDASSTPNIGMQIGVASENVVADDHKFENVKILGHFSLACLYNRAAETTGFDHVLLWNDHPGSFCLVQDGMNYFGILSQFSANKLMRNKELSFNGNEFINCDFRHGAKGTPVWLGDTSRHAFIRCYAATTLGPSFVIYCGSNSHTMLDIDCHCESFGLNDIFLFMGRSKRLVVRGFSYRDHRCYANGSVFSCAPTVLHIDLLNVNVEIASFQNAKCKLFHEPARWSVSGRYSSSEAIGWNGDDIFNGILTIALDCRVVGNAPFK